MKVLYQPLVSVIVPVYKVEDVLSRCLDSLCKQSLREIEIILVEDASPDRCGAICEQYAARDKRFRVFHHPENCGLSAARNTGIAHASADYLMFVDSDDWVNVDFCKLPYECAVQYGADLVMFRNQQITKDGSFATNDSKTTVFYKNGYKTHEEAIDLLLKDTGVCWSAWNKLYRKRLFCGISYPIGSLYEDIGTTYKTLLRANTVYYLNQVLYYHCYHDGSILTLKTDKALQDCIEMYMRQYRDLADWGYPKNKLERSLNNIALDYCIRKKPDVNDANCVFCRNTLQCAKTIPEDFTWRRKVLFVLMKYCPPLFDLVCEMWGKRW